MTEKLFYKETEIASVNFEEFDFPNSFGTFSLNESLDWSTSENSHLSNFIAHSVKFNQLLDISEAEAIKLIEQEEGQFQDLIDSDEWYMLNEAGKRTAIMIPNFCIVNRIVWRLN